MTQVPVVDASTTIRDASAAMLDDHVEAAIVVDGAKVRGVLTASDVADALAEGLDVGSTPVASVAHAHPPVVRAQEPLAEVRQRMRSAQDALVVVVGDDRRAVGVLADDGAGV